MFQLNFDDFLGPDTTGTGLEEVNLKISPDDFVLHPKHTHKIWGAFLII